MPYSFEADPNRMHEPALAHLLNDTLPKAIESGASQEVVESIKQALEIAHLKRAFLASTTSGESKACAQLFTDTRGNDWGKAHTEGKALIHYKPMIMTGSEPCALIKSFISAAKAKDVLEVGMFTGYSALSMAETLPADGTITTVDRDEYLKQFFLSHIQDSPHKDKVEVKIGNALEVMQQLHAEGKTYDAVFLDASKDEYGDYLKLCIDGNMLRPNGTIIVDNAFQGSSAYTKPDSTAAKFAKLIAQDPRLHVVTVPIRDGLFYIRRKQEVDGNTQ